MKLLVRQSVDVTVLGFLFNETTGLDYNADNPDAPNYSILGSRDGFEQYRLTSGFYEQ